MGKNKIDKGNGPKRNAGRGFTDRQLKFIEFYEGNGTDAARKAGYKGSDDVLGKTSYDLLRNPKITQAIKNREKPKSDYIIADRQQRQAFWTSIMKDESLYPGDRLRASELLGKSEGDFLTKIEVSGKVTLEDLVSGSLNEASEEEND